MVFSRFRFSLLIEFLAEVCFRFSGTSELPHSLSLPKNIAAAKKYRLLQSMSSTPMLFSGGGQR
jgi:hypothetical protein